MPGTTLQGFVNMKSCEIIQRDKHTLNHATSAKDNVNFFLHLSSRNKELFKPEYVFMPEAKCAKSIPWPSE